MGVDDEENMVDVVRNRLVAERGYTNHSSGMYADKFLHPRLQCDGGRYITIGDPRAARVSAKRL